MRPKRQRLLLHGKCVILPEDIARLVDRGSGRYARRVALWDLFVFLESGSMPLRFLPSIRRAPRVCRKNWWCERSG